MDEEIKGSQDATVHNRGQSYDDFFKRKYKNELKNLRETFNYTSKSIVLQAKMNH